LYELGSVFRATGAPGRPPLMGVDARPDEADLLAAQRFVPDQPWHVAAVLVGEVEPAGWWGVGRSAGWADAVQAARIVLSAARGRPGAPDLRVPARADRRGAGGRCRYAGRARGVRAGGRGRGTAGGGAPVRRVRIRPARYGPPVAGVQADLPGPRPDADRRGGTRRPGRRRGRGGRTVRRDVTWRLVTVTSRREHRDGRECRTCGRRGDTGRRGPLTGIRRCPPYPH